MRVLLVYANQSRDLVPAPPVGLAYVATATRAAGHDVRWLDLFGDPDPPGALRQAVRQEAPEVVGVSVRNIDNLVRQRPAAHLDAVGRLVAAVREASAAAVVLGGPAVSVLGPAVLERLPADFAVLGEGEAAFPRLLGAMATTRRYDAVEGLCYRRDGRVVASPPARLSAFGASGMQAWVDWRRYERAGGTWAVQTKRGCPLGCSYCAYPQVEGAACRRRPPGEVADEIERVAATVRPRTFEIVDSTFNVPAGHAEEVCRELARRRLGVRLTAMGVNPLGVSAELFALMRQAGFRSMMVTPESASDAVLRRLRKGFTAEHVDRAARLARGSGLASTWFFMLGGPGETRQTAEETVSFVERHLDWPGCLVVFMTGIRVLPGTELARIAVEEGRLAPDRDLSEPTFYLSPDVDEAWLLARVDRAIARCPAVVHAAEEGQSRYERLANALFARLGVAPPHWRFLPWLLRVPPVPALRRRTPRPRPARA